MTETPNRPKHPRDHTTIAPGVLVAIARQTALTVAGVAGMAPVPGGVNRLFRRGVGDGVQIEVESGRAGVDLYLVLGGESNVRQVGRTVQSEVTRAFEEMVGIPVDRVDIHVEDIDFGPPLA
jgi:uncharacterized alkaline shock family protein YloU